MHARLGHNELRVYLDQLKQEKPLTPDVFKQGIIAFYQIANLNAEGRLAVFGDERKGLHYEDDYATLTQRNPWNVTFTCPPDWIYKLIESTKVLLYRGNKPSAALDSLINGPTVIDCGMCAQLAIWFGLRHMLGNKKFDDFFGRGPLYITQLLYRKIPHAHAASLGNPLFPFFTGAVFKDNSAISVQHVPNDRRYQYKHPNGRSRGNNCLVLDDSLFIFKPGTDNVMFLSRKEVDEFLIDALNKPQDHFDQGKLALYKATNQNEIVSILGVTYGQLVEFAEIYKDLMITSENWQRDNREELSLQFNFQMLQKWVIQMTHMAAQSNVDYLPLPHHELKADSRQIMSIPYENRQISFATFQQDSELQREVHHLAVKFCHDIMRATSAMVVLSGKAGIGKTAVAACCAKELDARGKNILWVSENTIKGWINQAKSIADVFKVREQVQALLGDHIDVVFLDDDNLVGFAGKVLIEEIYAWYLSNKAKGLFITSNVTIKFDELYADRLSDDMELMKFCLPPLASYLSSAYMNRPVVRNHLDGQYLRAGIASEILALSDQQKLDALLHCRAGQSVGVIVRPETYLANAQYLGNKEYIPAFDDSEDIAPIRRHLAAHDSEGPLYQAMTPLQQKWLKKTKHLIGRRKEWRFNVKNFETTPFSVIVLEVLTLKYNWCKDYGQLLSIIHFAHDNGNRRVIILNKTQLTNEELYLRIVELLPQEEKERTESRLQSLLLTQALFDTTSENKSIKDNISGLAISIFHPKQPAPDSDKIERIKPAKTSPYQRVFLAAQASVTSKRINSKK